MGKVSLAVVQTIGVPDYSERCSWACAWCLSASPHLKSLFFPRQVIRPSAIVIVPEILE